MAGADVPKCVTARRDRHLQIGRRRQHDHTVHDVVAQVRQRGNVQDGLEHALFGRRPDAPSEKRMARRSRRDFSASRCAGFNTVDPAGVPFEGIGRQLNARTGSVAIEFPPIEVDAPHVHLADAAEDRLTVVMPRPERRQPGGVVIGQTSSGHSGQVRPRTDLDEDFTPFAGESLNARREANRLANMRPPVSGVGQLGA